MKSSDLRQSKILNKSLGLGARLGKVWWWSSKRLGWAKSAWQSVGITLESCWIFVASYCWWPKSCTTWNPRILWDRLPVQQQWRKQWANKWQGKGWHGRIKIITNWNWKIYKVRSNMGVSKNNGIPKSSILIGFSIINHPFWGTPIFGNIQMNLCRLSAGQAHSFHCPKQPGNKILDRNEMHQT